MTLPRLPRTPREIERSSTRAGLGVALDIVTNLLAPFADQEPAAGFDEGYAAGLAEVRDNIQAAIDQI